MYTKYVQFKLFHCLGRLWFKCDHLIEIYSGALEMGDENPPQMATYVEDTILDHKLAQAL